MRASDTLSARVLGIEPLSPTLKHIVLGAADGSMLPAAPPGAHVVLTLGSGNAAFQNAYLIVTPTDHRAHYAIIVRRVPQSRGGSAHVHEGMCVGDKLTITPPDNFFPIVQSARKHLLIGGGIGVTPFLGYLAALGTQRTRVEMHHLAQPDELPVFARLLAPHAAAVTLHPAQGRFDFLPILARQPLGTHVYTCGPAGMMDAVVQGARSLGWPQSAVHRESFGATGGKAFALTLARSGVQTRVRETQTMLDSIEAAGVAIDYLCRGGACGRCVTMVLDGVPDHRDHVLTPEEHAGGRVVMPCVSRSLSDYLVLDL